MLSKRLQTLADMIDTKRVIDVGCDHALLDIYLTLEKNIHCIAVDISPKVIEIAKHNIAKYGLENQITTIESNGVEKVNLTMEDTLVIAGMGTSTILGIIEKVNLPIPCLLLSNNHHEKLRRAMHKKRYYIEDEKVIQERGIYYVIIKFKKGYRFYTPMQHRFGPYAILNPSYREYLLEKYQKLEQQIPSNQKHQIKKNIRYLKKKRTKDSF